MITLKKMEKRMLRLLKEKDYEFVYELLPRINKTQFLNKVNGRYGYIIVNEKEEMVGILLFTILWEKLPFIEHLIIKNDMQNKGYGTKALKEFEDLMRKESYKMVLLSTQVDEKAQFLYRRLGYIDNGSLFFEETPFDQACELFLKKKL